MSGDEIFFLLINNLLIILNKFSNAGYQRISAIKYGEIDLLLLKRSINKKPNIKDKV